jgi:myo-inositol-1(or 4)-monophosphatase
MPAPGARRVGDVPDDVALAGDLARAAGRLALRMRTDPLDVQRKTSVSDVVTAADRACEELVVARLAAERSDDAVVAEEGASRAGTGTRTWYVDPLDGTYNYTAGIPFWCSALALVQDGSVLASAVYAAVSDELWVAGVDSPTTCNGEPVAALADRPLTELSVCSYLHPDTIGTAAVRAPLLRMISPAATVRMLGSGSVELAYVATGRVGAYAQYDSLPWDWYPGAGLVRGAGGTARVVEHGRYRWHLAGGARAVDDLSAGLG